MDDWFVLTKNERKNNEFFNLLDDANSIKFTVEKNVTTNYHF